MTPDEINTIIYYAYDNYATTYGLLYEINKIKDPLLKATIIFPLLGAMYKNKNDRYPFDIAELDLILEILKSSSNETRDLILAKVRFLGKMAVKKEEKDESPKDAKETEESIGEYQRICEKML